MGPFSHKRHHYSAGTIMFHISIVLLAIFEGSVSGATFTLVNKCGFTIWPGILGSPKLDTTGFELPKGGSRSFPAPADWSGRFWARTGCTFDSTTGQGSCSTADCNSGQVECNGATATPPATLAEFTLASQGLDYYDVSLVDGYNLPMIVEPSRGSGGGCASTGCLEDLNRKCPAELRVDGGAACKSACEAFGTPEYCCKGAFNSPATCKPSVYSEVFKSACPKSYSYAYDDATSTFTCSSADYTITFCPNFPSLKSARDSSPKATGTTGDDGSGTATEAGTEVENGMGSNSAQEAAFANPWLADLAIGDSTRSTHHPSLFLQFAILLATISLILFC